jgi:nanoRNase/pAp phosphatase (c-di-AMP/oligoRNAs hydrolase)
MICSGIFKNQIFYSIRSKNYDLAGVNAERIANLLNGSGGGHARVAAGRIPIENNASNKVLEKFESTVKTVFGITNMTEEKLL